ncbi:MAG TPA: hypothetical protein VEH29_15045 [Acidimicrobiales bacterium]|nr:hypothetical protein [Acidimicrobiales bacterium]
MTDQARTTEDLLRRVVDLERENERLRGLLRLYAPARREPVRVYEPRLVPVEPLSDQRAEHLRSVTRSSPSGEKLALYRSLFIGRDDVYALRWESARTGKSGWSPAVRGGFQNARSPVREHLPLTDDVIASHLGGEIHVGAIR